MNRREKALADLDATLRLDPRNTEALADRLSADDYAGQYDRVVAHASALLKLDPNNARAYLLRGNAWNEKGQYANARADYEDVLRIDPGHEVASHNLRGVMERLSGKRQ